MPLSNILRRELTRCDPSTPLSQVADLMLKNEVGAVLVIDNRKPVGIITDRDLVLRCLAKRLDPDALTAEEIMSRPVESVSENEGIYGVVRKMRNAWVRRVPIVDAQGEAIGLLSFDDIFELIADEMNFLKEVVRPRETKISTQAA